jgi:hypothetical protein
LGIIAAYIFLGISITDPGYFLFANLDNGEPNTLFYTFFFTDALIVLIVSLFVGSWMTLRKAKLQNQPVWDITAKRLLINMMIPLFAGGIYCIILL